MKWVKQLVLHFQQFAPKKINFKYATKDSKTTFKLVALACIVNKGQTNLLEPTLEFRGCLGLSKNILYWFS